MPLNIAIGGNHSRIKSEGSNDLIGSLALLPLVIKGAGLTEASWLQVLATSAGVLIANVAPALLAFAKTKYKIVKVDNNRPRQRG